MKTDTIVKQEGMKALINRLGFAEKGGGYFSWFLSFVSWGSFPLPLICLVITRKP